MAEPEKCNSSAGEGSGKMPQLDEDISNDLLTSWKPMSLTGNDDVDFNFEPVTKGNRKAFDFGKLDMDFSLDGEFGKLSSFKLDMPDLDFSSSPQKPTKSKEKSKEESVKGNRPVKKNGFSFSFDFNGLDDFSLDGPPTKEGGHPSREKGSKEVGSKIEIQSDDLSRLVATDNKSPEDTISKRPPPVPQDAPNSKSEDLLNNEGSLDASRRNCPSKSEIVVDLIQPKATQVLPEEILAAKEMDHQNHPSDETANKSYAQGTVHDFDPVPESRSTSLPVPLELANIHIPSETKITESSEGCDQVTQAIDKNSKLLHAELKVEDSPAILSPIKTTTQATFLEGMDDCSANGTSKCLSFEGCIVTGTLPAAVVSASDTEKEKPEKLSQQQLTDKASTSDENSGLGGVIACSGARLALNTVDPFAPGVPAAMSTDAQYHAEAPRSTSKYFSTPFGREENAKIFVRKDLVSEKTEKNVDADDVFRESIVNMSRGVRNGVDANTASQDEQAMKDRVLLPGSGKKINDPKSSSPQVPSVFTGGEKKFSNKHQEKFEDKIPSIVSVLKSNSSESNKLYSLKSGKKLSSLPNLKIPVTVTTAKYSASPTMQQNAKFVVKSNKSVRFQTMNNLVPAIGAEKERPSTPSSKRKPSEAGADGRSINLRPSKRLSPSENTQMAKEVPVTEAEDEVHTQAVQLEGSRRNDVVEHPSPKFDFHQEANVEELGLTLLVENNANIEKAEACAKELEHICSMLKKKHEEAKELLVRALMNNNNLLMLNHPIYEEKIQAVQRFASRLMYK